MKATNQNVINDDEQQQPKYEDPNGLDITKTELVNLKKLKFLVDNATDYEDVLIKPSSQNGDDDDWTIQGVVTGLKKYMKRVKEGKEVSVKYKQRNNLGRYFAKSGVRELNGGMGGLQNMPRVVRHTIAGEYYWDVDMKNAHPSLLLKYCRDKGWKCDKLSEFVKDREIYFRELGGDNYDKDIVKKFYLSVLNGKKLSNDEGRFSDAIVDFYNELEKIRENVMKHNPELVKIAKENKRKAKKSLYNLDGSVVNLLMCDMENRCLVEMMNYFAYQEVEVDVLCFDGLMIRKEYIPESEIEVFLRGCEEYILENLKYPITLTTKDMDEGIDISEEDLIEMKTYHEIKEEFEKHHFKCITPPWILQHQV